MIKKIVLILIVSSCLALLTSACTAGDVTKSPASVSTTDSVTVSLDLVLPTDANTADEVAACLAHAKPYVVVGEGNLVNEEPTRSAALWFVTANDADGYEEYAQTALLAAIDLYLMYGNNFTSVLLIPNEEVEYAASYANASYAADGRGAWGMTGSAPAKPMYWHARAMDDVPYNVQELAVIALRQEKMFDFPNKDPLSSLSYDEPALRHYVAETLQIPYSETEVRQLNTRDYKVPEVPLEQTEEKHMPIMEESLDGWSTAGFTAAELTSIETLADKIPNDLRVHLKSMYVDAETVSKDKQWMVFSSWRPYTQAYEYKQLLEFCTNEGTVVWPLLFQQLENDDSQFTAGLILDMTLPKYLYYFEKACREVADPQLVLPSYFRQLLKLS